MKSPSVPLWQRGMVDPLCLRAVREQPLQHFAWTAPGGHRGTPLQKIYRRRRDRVCFLLLTPIYSPLTGTARRAPTTWVGRVGHFAPLPLFAFSSDSWILTSVSCFSPFVPLPLCHFVTFFLLHWYNYFLYSLEVVCLAWNQPSSLNFKRFKFLGISLQVIAFKFKYVIPTIWPTI